MPDEAYKGFARIPNANDDYNELAFVFQQLASRMATSQPVQVRAVGGTPSEPTVDVQPMVAQINGAGDATLHGIIHNVPVLLPRGGTNGFVVQPVVGDIGLAVFASHDISSVKANKAPSNPGSRRRFDWADAQYIPGYLGATLLQWVAVGGIGIRLEAPLVSTSNSLSVGNGATGVFTTTTGQLVTVMDGIIISIS